MIDTLVNRMAEFLEICPDKTAVAFKQESLTYKQLYKRMSGISKILKENGIQAGDRVAFSAVSKPEMAAVYLGIQMCGGVAVFLDKNATAENMRKVYDESGSRLLLTDKPMKTFADGCNVKSLRELYAKADGVDCGTQDYALPKEDDLAELLFTTGTTGVPKGVMLTYRSVYHIFQNTIEGIGITSDDRLLLPLPLNHSFALRVLRAVLYQGATVVLQNGFTFAKEIENNVTAFGCNALACVPASYEVMRSQMQDSFATVLGDMRLIEFGAGSLSIRQRKEITSLLPNVQIYNTWGSSESGGAIFCDVCDVVKNEAYIGALGKPLAGKVQVKILDPEGNTIESDALHPGRMTLKGEMQMAGYWNNSQATSETLKDGWLLTGDMAYLQDGYVFMLGRADDIINVGGEKVSPIEVENIAGQYEFIKECACIGAEDEKGVLGQVPVLFVVTKSGYSENDFVKFLSEKMERYKLPQKFVTLLELPRNRMQKIDRRALREILENKDGIALMNPVVEAILKRRSIRKFTDQEIPKELLDMILQCGYHAPSGHNMQSWRFTVLTKAEDILKLKDAAKKAAEENKVHFYGFENPKVMILVSNDTRNSNGCQDASCAAENMMLAAQSYGIGSVWLNPLVTLRNVEPVKSVLDEFAVPQGHTVWAAVALGYPVSEGAKLQKKTNVINYR